jgi:hypothetical protein
MSTPDALQTLSLFEPRVGELFIVRLDENRVHPLTLVKASLIPSGNYRTAREPFQLRFRGPGPQHLPQQIHLMENDALGSIAIFLVPIGRDGDGFIYQAIFN